VVAVPAAPAEALGEGKRREHGQDAQEQGSGQQDGARSQVSAGKLKASGWLQARVCERGAATHSGFFGRGRLEFERSAPFLADGRALAGDPAG
jgi:hypothetical protein